MDDLMYAFNWLGTATTTRLPPVSRLANRQVTDLLAAHRG